MKDAGIEGRNAQKLVDRYRNLDPIMDMDTVAEKGIIAIRNSYNLERDLLNRYKGTVAIGRGASAEQKVFTRPAVGKTGDKIFWSDMVMDNWRVASREAGVETSSIKFVGRDNVVTPEIKALYEQLMGSEKKMEFADGTPGFDRISKETPHGKGVIRLLGMNAEGLGNKQVKSYTVFSETVNRKQQWNMLIELA